jgi:hypothetical protein
VELLRHGHEQEAPPRSSQNEANHDHEESLSDNAFGNLEGFVNMLAFFKSPVT